MSALFVYKTDPRKADTINKVFKTHAEFDLWKSSRALKDYSFVLLMKGHDGYYDHPLIVDKDLTNFEIFESVCRMWGMYSGDRGKSFEVYQARSSLNVKGCL